MPATAVPCPFISVVVFSVVSNSSSATTTFASKGFPVKTPESNTAAKGALSFKSSCIIGTNSCLNSSYGSAETGPKGSSAVAKISKSSKAFNEYAFTKALPRSKLGIINKSPNNLLPVVPNACLI